MTPLRVVVLLKFVLLREVTAASYNLVESKTSTIDETKEVKYSCDFKSLWTTNRHPNSYPATTAKWKSPMLVSHHNNYQLWSPDTLASNGLAEYAETGNYNDLLMEVLDGDINIGDVGLGRNMDANGIFDEKVQYQYRHQVMDDLIVSSYHAYMSAVASMQPASDWFTGFYTFRPWDPSTRTWYSSFTIETMTYDAGTETGDTYSLGNSAETRQQPISQLSINTVPATSVLIGPKNTVLTVAAWNCTLASYLQFTSYNANSNNNNDFQNVPIQIGGKSDDKELFSYREPVSFESIQVFNNPNGDKEQNGNDDVEHQTITQGDESDKGENNDGNNRGGIIAPVLQDSSAAAIIAFPSPITQSLLQFTSILIVAVSFLIPLH